MQERRFHCCCRPYRLFPSRYDLYSGVEAAGGSANHQQAAPSATKRPSSFSDGTSAVRYLHHVGYQPKKPTQPLVSPLVTIDTSAPHPPQMVQVR